MGFGSRVQGCSPFIPTRHQSPTLGQRLWTAGLVQHPDLGQAQPKDGSVGPSLPQGSSISPGTATKPPKYCFSPPLHQLYSFSTSSQFLKPPYFIQLFAFPSGILFLVSFCSVLAPCPSLCPSFSFTFPLLGPLSSPNPACLHKCVCVCVCVHAHVCAHVRVFPRGLCLFIRALEGKLQQPEGAQNRT